MQFLENDIDRPIIVGALYNGQGEGGIAPTPAGQLNGESQASRFDPAHDHATSAQGNIAGGSSLLWHGASSDTKGHRNGAAHWGVRSKEFGASGYNQLLFDDTDAQGRIQLKSSHAATELNLGHLIHSADNYRGSFRGHGAELRTDAYGAVRAGAGLLITSYKINHNASARDAAGDNAPAIAMLKQAVALGEAFSGAAMKHETVVLASHAGAARANAGVLDEKAPPLKALLTAVSGMAQPEPDVQRVELVKDGKVVVTSEPLITEQEIVGQRADIIYLMHSAYLQLCDDMAGFQSEWTTHGMKSMMYSARDGMQQGSAAWVDDQAAFFDRKTWTDFGDKIADFAVRARDTMSVYAEEQLKRYAADLR